MDPLFHDGLLCTMNYELLCTINYGLLCTRNYGLLCSINYGLLCTMNRGLLCTIIFIGQNYFICKIYGFCFNAFNNNNICQKE